MDTINNALLSFTRLLNYKYIFKIAGNGELYNIELTFGNTEFYHLAGFQYLKDIDIPKSHKNLYDKINSGKINDIYLESSIYYKKSMIVTQI